MGGGGAGSADETELMTRLKKRFAQFWVESFEFARTVKFSRDLHQRCTAPHVK